MNLSATARLAIGLIAVSFLLRIICATVLPISGDEALYWSYSKHLGWGYVDHPIINPLMIRIGTTLFGDTSLGVRIMPLLLSLPASWAMWRAGTLLFDDADAGAMAALIFNLTIAVSVGSFIATSDASVIVASAFVLYSLAKLETTGKAHWWLAAGLFVGLGMLCKYTMVFIAVGIVLRVLLAPTQRKWLFHPYSFAAGAVSLLIFSPVLWWNAHHEWVSFVYQAGRTHSHGLTLNYLSDYVGSQAAYLTPPVFVLGILAFLNAPGSLKVPASVRILVLSLITPTLLYFAWHSLHERVEGNWPEVMYPAYAMAATMIVHTARSSSDKKPWIRWSHRLMIPIAAGLALLVYAQALIGPIPLGRKDPVSRELAYGWQGIARQVEAARRDNDAASIITSDYTTNSWLRFYLPSRVDVTQINERLRWANEPSPPQSDFNSPMLYICRDGCQFLDEVRSGFGDFRLIEKLTRKRNGLFIETYSIYLASQPISSPYDLIRKPLVKGRDSKPKDTTT